MDKMQKVAAILERDFYNNSFQQWLVAALIFLVVFLGLSTLKGLLGRRFRKKADQKLKRSVFADLLRILAATRKLFLIILALRMAIIVLELSPQVYQYAGMLTTVAFLLQVALWGRVAILIYTQRYRQASLKTNAASAMTVGALSFLSQLVLYTLIVILTLDNLGINVTALIAGLGIGGIAVALAAQNVLKDLFASLAIVLDRPFEIGDFIILDDFKGEVEATGIKTTRIRSLSGEQIILPNSNLVESRIRNYKRMDSRRVLFHVGVTYDTPLEKLKKIAEMIKEIILKQEKTRFDRAHLFTFADSSLNYEIVYYVLDSDYNVYMDIQHRVNLGIVEAFEKAQIEIAFPTRKLIIDETAASSGAFQ